MKKLGLLLMVLTLGVYMGCEAQTEVDTAPPAADTTDTPAVDEGADVDVDVDPAATSDAPAGDVDLEVTPPAEGDAAPAEGDAAAEGAAPAEGQ